MTEYDAIVKTAKETFAKRLKKALEEKGCETLVKKAELLGVTDDQIRNYEKGRSFPPAGQLVYFARCLGCSVDYLTDERVTVKTPDTDVKSVAQATGLSEESAKLLVTMKKAWPSETASLDAVLRNSARITPIGISIAGLVGALSDYFKAASEKNNSAVPDGPGVKVLEELSHNEKLARFEFWNMAANLLDGPDRGTLLGLYADKLNELTKKGCSDNGNSKTDNH